MINSVMTCRVYKEICFGINFDIKMNLKDYKEEKIIHIKVS